MWAGDRVYFISDRNGPATLFYYDIKTKAVKAAIPAISEALAHKGGPVV